MLPGLSSLMAIVKAELLGAGRCSTAIVGAGGKTSSLFALSRAFSARGSRVLVATTTRMLDPERGSVREGRGFAPLVLAGGRSLESAAVALAEAGSPVLLCASRSGDKLLGVDPPSFDALAAPFDLAFVEADGARGLSIKAPAEREPVVPSSCAIVIGLVGLDSLGEPLDGGIAHRPELLSALVGCPLGSRIEAAHIAALAASPRGLFKSAPDGARRVLLLNKADLADRGAVEGCVEALGEVEGLDAIVVGALGAAEEP
ncbi:MAG TPA: selenium cofactor biosynthesis protein YqeC [Spirochaetales bacterium]|nr:selenium cofactor biosynthesis protein YqeC [Spirochaetales bacterium]HRY56108.1 selenium cofactor biosynthesis protein YqeC [Spirochaetia bacterium]HRZ65350.1 selenium cofactor biosynthesis protein YqeC [Spirochaetia bacterium]